MRTDRDYDELLAGGLLSGHQREALLRGALRNAGIYRRRRWLRALLYLTPAAAAVGALVLVTADDAMRVKGGTTTGAPVVEIGCASTGGPRCRQGDTLLFSIDGRGPGGYLTAFAEPEAGHAGERVWYFPVPTRGSAAFAAHPERQTLRDGVRIGPEQPAGRYRVHLIVSAQPLTREQALALARGDLHAIGAGVGVSRLTTLPLEVLP